MGTPPDTEPKTHEVPNPDYAALEALKTAVQGAEHSIGTALKSAAAQMTGGSAWTGPTAATDFTQEIEGRSNKLPGLVQQILSAVEDEMASTPKTVTRPLNAGMRAQ